MTSVRVLFIVLLLSGCASNTIFDRDRGFDLISLHNFSPEQVVTFLQAPQSKYKIKKNDKKNTSTIYYTHINEQKKSRGRFGFGNEFFAVDFEFLFKNHNKLTFIKIVHSYTGRKGGRFSQMKNEYNSMVKSFTKKAGPPTSTEFGRNGLEYSWKINAKNGQQIKIISNPPRVAEKSKHGYNYMVITKIFFK